jgi:hypothetical protein
LTLDDDVAARLKQEARRSGKPFRTVVNDTLRAGFLERHTQSKQPPFEVKPQDLGLRKGLGYESIEALLEIAEGPSHK